MSSDTGKAAIIAMWTAAAVIDFAVAISTTENANPIGWPFVVPIVVALFGTIFIWMRLESHALQASRAAEPDKSKRQTGDKLSLLLELMDDDERAAFKKRLQQQVLEEASYPGDGELSYGRAASIESLLSEEETQERLRR